MKKNELFIFLNRKFSEKITFFITAFVTVLLLLVGSTSAVRADSSYFGVNYTTEKDPGTYYVGVAGRPDCYPYEYYDEDSKTYKGIFPEIYARIYSKTGLRFTYTQTGPDDNQLVQAKQGYDEIISCCSLSEDDMALYNLCDPITVAVRLNGDSEETLSIVFTETASDTRKAQIAEAVSHITDEDILEMMSHYTLYPTEKADYRWLILPVGIAAAIVLALVIKKIRALIRAVKAEKDSRMDEKTGLLSRKGFTEKFELLSKERYKASYLLAFISFPASILNLRAGYDITERIIEKASAVIKEHVKNDICARYTGSAFTVLHVSLGEKEAVHWILSLLYDLNDIIKAEDLENMAQFNAGLCRIDSTGWNLDQLIKSCTGYYQKAVSQKMPYYMPGSRVVERDHFQSVLEDQVRQALNENQFCLYLQPLVDASTGKIVGAEGLSRWHHPDLGLIMPGRYIDMMIQNNQIMEHDIRQITLAAAILEKWQANGIDIFLSVNVTRITTSEGTAAQSILDAIAPYHFDRSHMVIEITEDSLTVNQQQAVANTRTLTEAGLRIALDDLGSGYSFFSDLTLYPFSEAKIDRSLLLGAVNERGRALMAGLMNTCRSIDITIVTEGVETGEQLELVRELGTDLIQGFYYSQPIPLDEFEKMLENQQV